MVIGVVEVVIVMVLCEGVGNGGRVRSKPVCEEKSQKLWELPTRVFG